MRRGSAGNMNADSSMGFRPEVVTGHKENVVGRILHRQEMGRMFFGSQEKGKMDHWAELDGAEGDWDLFVAKEPVGGE